MKDEMMAKIMDEVMKKMGGTEAPAQSMACEAPQGINEVQRWKDTEYF